MSGSDRFICGKLTLADAMREANRAYKQLGDPYFVMRHRERGEYAVGSLSVVLSSPEWEVIPAKSVNYTAAQIREAEEKCSEQQYS